MVSGGATPPLGTPSVPPAGPPASAPQAVVPAPAPAPAAAAPAPTSSSASLLRWGGVAVLAVPLLLGALAALMLVLWPCEGTGCVEPSLAAWTLALVAVPTAIPSGLPWIVQPLNVAIAGATSLLVWILLGRLAARRAARTTGRWRSYWIELAFMTGGIGVGLAVGFLAIALWLRV